jgi:transcriptional regulator with XRE-family HTH domain
MAETEPHSEFRLRLQRARRQKSLSQRAIGEALADHGGEPVSGSAVGEWERGQSYPTRRNALALERALDQAPGTLTRLLGYDPEDSDGVSERLAAVESALERVVKALDALVERRR